MERIQYLVRTDLGMIMRAVWKLRIYLSFGHRSMTILPLMVGNRLGIRRLLMRHDYFAVLLADSR